MSWPMLIEAFRKTPEFTQIAGALARPGGSAWGIGADRTAASLVEATLASVSNRPLLILIAEEEEAVARLEEIRSFSGFGPSKALLFPAPGRLPYETLAPSAGLFGERLRVLEAASLGRARIVLCPWRAALTRLIPPKVYSKARCTVKAGESLDPAAFFLRAAELGYERVLKVENPGEVARRGDILDIFPGSIDEPVRIEFFGEMIERMTHYDPATQRATIPLSSADIPPAREIVVDADAQARAAEILRAHKFPPGTENGLAELLEALAEDPYFAGVDTYLSFLYPSLSLLTGFFPTPPLLVIEEPMVLSSREERFRKDASARFQSLSDVGRPLPSPEACFASLPEILPAAFSRLFLSAIDEFPSWTTPETRADLPFRHLVEAGGRWDLLRPVLQRQLAEGHRIFLACETEGRLARTRELLREERFPQDGGRPGTITLLPGTVAASFFHRDLAIAVLGHRQAFGGRPTQQRRKGRYRPGVKLADYTDLTEGDYVVHTEYGIGIYRGLILLSADGAEAEFLSVEYAGNDKIYVPLNQFSVLSRYVGGEGSVPRLSRLGTAHWQKAKSRIRRGVAELAKKLYELYAQRLRVSGYAFPEDTEWQREFEASFPYEETPDQARAAVEIKKDLETARPMDRLLCGDVGYGKTEVAMRAIFKVVQDGRQAAILVPTTLLAQQHYEVFRERFGDFPVRVGVLSRLRVPAERRKTLDAAAAGKTDVLIGTHGLLGAKVSLPNLGLVVIDEEHRFGVAQKEHLKSLRLSVDCLSMSATPIPRTLHMALSNIRDMSVIATPPPDRLPVQTFVERYDETTLQEAIQRELDRGGQAFVVHHRVQGIGRVRDRLVGLLPDVRFTVAHGQMPEREIEKAMVDFLERRADVLVTTSIIESGLDLPNVNTLIVTRADRFGLAQLYQLRGRVGRSDRQAYAYFFHPGFDPLSRAARERLRAVAEMDELGAGFKLALRDLEIRGMGEYFGPEQHGYIESVGYELYQSLLGEAVAELKGEPSPEPVPLQIRFQVSAYLPDDYVEDETERIAIYKRIAELTNREETADLEAELRDRFGRLPQPAVCLLEEVNLKLQAVDGGLRFLGKEGGFLRAEFRPGTPRERDLAKRSRELARQVHASLSKKGRVALGPPLSVSIPWEWDEAKRFESARRLLELLADE